jgi:hypothetical protein
MLRIERNQNMKLFKVKTDLLAISSVAFLLEVNLCSLFLFALQLLRK